MAGYASGPVEVSVPATSANLGPGFDALGLALGFRDRVTADVTSSGLQVTVNGAGEGTVALDESHLIFRSMARAFETIGVPVPGIRLHCENNIPHGRGLGSSSAAIVAGVCLARALVEGGESLLADDDAFALAAAIEGHPDNVAPAFYGGFTIAYEEGGRFHSVSVPVDPRIGAVAFVPTTPLETRVARGLLPESVPHRDAAANAGRAALLVAALSGRPDLLVDATREWLHQEYRQPAMPESLHLVRSLRSDGLAAVVSGAGPTVLVLCDNGEREAVAELGPAHWRARVLDVDPAGAVVVRM